MHESSLQVLGSFVLRRAPGEAPLRLGRKNQALLGYLAAQYPGAASRTQVADLLWPDLTAEGARNALRQCLHQLRRASGNADGIDSEGDQLQLQPQAWDVDLWRFRRLAGASEPHQQLDALQLYRGRLLEGLEAGAEWDQWLAGAREDLRRAAHVLVARLSESVAAPQSEVVIRTARLLLAEDPVHEGGYRALMVLQDRMGLRASALQLWEECRRALRRELDAEPSPETRALHERLRQRDQTETAPGSTTQLSRPELPLGRVVPTSGAPVQDHMLRGWQSIMHGSPEENANARVAFRRALAIDARHPEALAMLGWTHFYDFVFGWTQDSAESFEAAGRVAQQALAQHPAHPAPRALNGRLLLWRHDYEAALDELERARAGLPQSPYSYSSLAEAHMRCGQHDEALRLTARALEMEPNDRGVFLTLEGFTRYLRGELGLARVALESAVTRNPRFCPAFGVLAAVLADLGELSAARATAQHAARDNYRVSLDFARRVMPLRDAASRQRLVCAWRLAGAAEHDKPWVPAGAAQPLLEH